MVQMNGASVITLCSCMYAGTLVASGKFSAEVFAGKHPHDGAALKILIDEAGGKMTDLAGNEQRYDIPMKMNGYVASNGLCHEELLALVKATMQRESNFICPSLTSPFFISRVYYCLFCAAVFIPLFF